MCAKKLLGKRVILITLCVSFILLSNAFTSAGEEYPTRPIKLIIPFSPGGVADIIWRAMGDPMGKVLGQPVVIENKPGGAGSLGYTMVATSKPDGYTVSHISLGSFINNYLIYDVSYNPTKSFTIIGGVARYAEALVVKSDAPWKTWDEFIDYSKKHPNEIKIGFSGAASTGTIGMKWISKKLGIKWKEITFPGDAEGITALLGGHIDAFPGAGAQNMQVRDGRARMLLAVTVEPIPGFPDVPTFKKLYGKDTMNGCALIGPAGIPEPVLAKLEKAVHEGTKDPGPLKAMNQMNTTPLWRNSKVMTQDVNAALISFRELLEDLDMVKKK